MHHQQQRPQQSYQAPPQQARPGILGGGGGGLGSAIATGMAFGAGSAIAHEAVRGVMGGGSHGAPAQQQQPQYVEGQAQPQQMMAPAE